MATGTPAAHPAKPAVVVVGDVMVDVVVRPTGPFNAGSDTACQIAVTPGGSATNKAVALAAAGAEAHLVAAVGDDELGSAAARAVLAAGVEAHLTVVPGHQTGVVVVLVGPSGERSMLTDRGANAYLDAGSLGPDLLHPGRHLHLSGYQLLDAATRRAAQSVLELARAAGMTLSVDPSSAGPLTVVGATAFLSWTEPVDWCFANLEEGRILTGCTEPRDVLAGLLRYYHEVVLTLGGAGALFVARGGDAVHCPAEPVPVTDTTGAGDAFTGTFLAKHLSGESPEEALRAGMAAAAQVVRAPGARGWPA